MLFRPTPTLVPLCLGSGVNSSSRDLCCSDRTAQRETSDGYRNACSKPKPALTASCSLRRSSDCGRAVFLLAGRRRIPERLRGRLSRIGDRSRGL